MALAVLALSLGVLLQSFATGANAVVVSERYSEALALAQGQIAEAGLTHALQEGVEQGQYGIYQWRLEVSRYAEAPGQQTFSPFVVRAEVDWPEFGRTRTLQLSTLRLGAAEGP